MSSPAVRNEGEDERWLGRGHEHAKTRQKRGRGGDATKLPSVPQAALTSTVRDVILLAIVHFFASLRQRSLREARVSARERLKGRETQSALRVFHAFLKPGCPSHDHSLSSVPFTARAASKFAPLGAATTSKSLARLSRAPCFPLSPASASRPRDQVHPVLAARTNASLSSARILCVSSFLADFERSPVIGNIPSRRVRERPLC